MLEQPAPPAPQPPLVDDTGEPAGMDVETEVEMEIEDATAGAGGGEGPPAILGQLLEGGVSPVELARLAQSGRRHRLGACLRLSTSSSSVPSLMQLHLHLLHLLVCCVCVMCI